MSEVFHPHEYQARGIQLLVSNPGGCGLLLDPGMGKTVIASTAYQLIKDEVPELKMLVIVPINAMYGTWPKELAKWEHTAGLKVAIIHGTLKKRIAALESDADVYLVNPEGIKWLLETYRGKLPHWQVLCVDESTKFKNSQSRRFKILKNHLHRFVSRWIMTGTVCPNGLIDLFSQVYIMDRGQALGPYITRFREAYFYQSGYGGYAWEPREGALEEIVKRIDSKTLQLKAEDYLDMPDFIKVERKVELPDEARDLYDTMEEEFIIEFVDRDIIASNAAVKGNKCRQIANGCIYDSEGQSVDLHNAKLAALEEIVEETNGHPLLIMYEYQHDRDKIMKFLGDDAVCITGMKDHLLRKALEFFNEGKLKYLVMHPGSTHGINIQQSCHHIVWFSIIWNLEHYIQANTRLYRQGQSSQSVMCYHLVAESTMDEVVSRVLTSKAATQAEVENALRRHCGISEEVVLPRTGDSGDAEGGEAEGGRAAEA